MSSLRSHGSTCPAPVRTLVEHKRDVVGIDPPRPTQLEGRFLSSKTILPVGQMSSPARLASLPKTTRSGGVDTSEQVTVFHPLNGSGAKGTTGRSNASRRKQEGYSKGFYPRDTITAQHQRPVVPSPVIISTGLPFLFRSPEPLFLLPAKEKVVLAPAGQAKNNRKIKRTTFPQKRKRFYLPHP